MGITRGPRHPDMDDYHLDDVAATTIRRRIAYRLMNVGWRALDPRARRAYMLALDHGAKNLGPRITFPDPPITHPKEDPTK